MKYACKRSVTIAVIALVAGLAGAARADVLDQDNAEANHSGWSGIGAYRWEGQTFTPTRPLLTGVEFYGLPDSHSWNTLPAGTTITVEIWATSGGLPATLLGSASRVTPLAETNWQGRFDFATPIDVEYGIGYSSSVAVLWTVPDSGVSGELTTGFSGDTYGQGVWLESLDRGASWQMRANRDLVFRTYGETPAYDGGLKYYGYYEEDDGRFGYFGPETYPYTNFIHLAPLSHDFLRNRLGEAVNVGQRLIIDTSSFFQSRSEGDWDGDFGSYGAILAPYSSHIAAVFVYDEPYTSDGGFPSPNAYEPNQVEHMIQVINDHLPGVKTLINFIPNSTDHWAVPYNLDYVATTAYFWWSPNQDPLVKNGPTSYAEFQTAWAGIVDNKVRPWAAGRPLWIMASSYQGVPGVLPNPPYPWLGMYPSAAEAQWYRDILGEPTNQDVIGLSWYIYTSEYTYGYYSSAPDNEAYATGARVAPAELQDFQKSWGRDIGDQPYLGPVDRMGWEFNPGYPFTGLGVKPSLWWSSPMYVGDSAYNMTGVALMQVAGDAPPVVRVGVYKVPTNNGTDLPSEATLITSQEWAGETFIGDVFKELPFDEPINVQAGAKYLLTVECDTTASGEPNDLWYLFAEKNLGPLSGSVATSDDQGTTWTTGMVDQGFFTPYAESMMRYQATMRDDLNPPFAVNQAGMSSWRSLEYGDWVGQSFTTWADNITGFAFGGAEFNSFEPNEGSLPVVRACLYEADGAGLPTGAPLVSLMVDIAELGGFPRIDFGMEIPLTAGKYVATLEQTNPGMTGDWLVGYQASGSPLVGDGQALHSTDQGGTWAVISGPEDWKFRTFFNPPEALCGDTRHPWPGGDVNLDCYVNLVDFGTLAHQWLADDCGDAYSWCYGADLNRSSAVGLTDLGDLSGTWLECTDPEAPCGYQP